MIDHIHAPSPQYHHSARDLSHEEVVIVKSDVGFVYRKLRKDVDGLSDALRATLICLGNKSCLFMRQGQQV